MLPIQAIFNEFNVNAFSNWFSIITQVVLSFVCVAINTTYAGLAHGIENELLPPLESHVPVYADHSNALQSEHLHEIHHEQHHAYEAPQQYAGLSFSVHPAPAISVQHSQPIVSHQPAASTYAVQHAQPAVIHQGPEALSSFGDAHLQGHVVNGQLVSEQVVGGQLENGALVSHSHGPVTIVRVC